MVTKSDNLHLCIIESIKQSKKHNSQKNIMRQKTYFFNHFNFIKQWKHSK